MQAMRLQWELTILVIKIVSIIAALAVVLMLAARSFGQPPTKTPPAPMAKLSVVIDGATTYAMTRVTNPDGKTGYWESTRFTLDDCDRCVVTTGFYDDGRQWWRLCIDWRDRPEKLLYVYRGSDDQPYSSSPLRADFVDGYWKMGFNPSLGRVAPLRSDHRFNIKE